MVVHGLRGRASNRKIDAETREQAMEILKQPDWHDFGPTFAGEQLAKRHGIRGQQRDAAPVDDRGRNVEERAHASWKRCIAGGRGGAHSANWCSGTPPSMTGWRDADRCVIWCG